MGAMIEKSLQFINCSGLLVYKSFNNCVQYCRTDRRNFNTMSSKTSNVPNDITQSLLYMSSFTQRN